MTVVQRVDAGIPAFHDHMPLHVPVAFSSADLACKEMLPELQIFWQYISRASV